MDSTGYMGNTDLNLHPVDALELAASRNRPLPQTTLSVIGSPGLLPMILELFALRWHWWQRSRTDLFAQYPEVNTLVGSIPSLAHFAALHPEHCLRWAEARIESSGAEILEVPAPGAGWHPGQPIRLAQEAFASAVRKQGHPYGFAAGLAAAFVEIASNAMEHANAPIPPVACFQVTNNHWAFGVTDVGRGVRASLSENPAFAYLRTDQEALKQAIQEGVSRHQEAGRGLGFNTVFKALVDHSAILRFRSGGAAGSWQGASPTAQRVVLQSLPVGRKGGFQVSAYGTHHR